MFYKVITLLILLIANNVFASENVLEQPLLVFASFSMPNNSLKQLSYQVSKAGGVLVFRGMHQGSLKKTVQLMQELNDKQVAAVIHPQAFSQYKVDKVPTFIIQPENIKQCMDHCTPIIDKMVGNVPLRYVLEQFSREGDNKELARKALHALEREYE